MADIINLRRVRKNKAHELKKTIAAQNRLKFGQKKSDSKLHNALEQQAHKQLDGHKRDTD